jgi:heme-degrading monooxygenase HmoA
VFSISFIFKPGTYDDEFQRLDAAVGAVAKSTEGFLGSESWWSKDGTKCNAIYYWADLKHLSDFAQAMPHKEAKASYDRWYHGYQVVVAEIRSAYGDGRLEHITTPIANIRRPARADQG